MLDDEKGNVALSVYLGGEYGQSDLYIEAQLSWVAKGVVSVIEILLTLGGQDECFCNTSKQ